MTAEQEAELGRLMRLGQDGDRQAYETLLRAVAVVVRRYATVRAGDVPWLDDVVQETLLTVHRARHTYDPQRPFAPWLYAIAKSRLVDAVRRSRRLSRRETTDDAAVAEVPTPVEDPFEAGAAARELRAALGALPDPQRRVLELLKLEELPVREVSARLGLSQANVKVIAHRAYKALRRHFGERSRGY